MDTAKGAGLADPPAVDLATAEISNEKNGTRDYQGGVSYHSIDRTFASVVCRANNRDAKYAMAVGAGLDTANSGQVGAAAGDGAAIGCEETGAIAIEVK